MNSLKKEKYQYLVLNLLKGFVWLALIIGAYLVFKIYFDDSFDELMLNIVNRPILIVSVFTLSELVFGIIPPELFMIWAVHQDSISLFITYTILFGTISYLAGATGYYFGHRFSMTTLYTKITSKFADDMESNVRKYGGFMLFIAAATPVPYTAVCMIMGASKYNFYNFLLIGLSRIVRFGVYGYMIWEVNQF